VGVGKNPDAHGSDVKASRERSLTCAFDWTPAASDAHGWLDCSLADRARTTPSIDGLAGESITAERQVTLLPFRSESDVKETRRTLEARGVRGLRGLLAARTRRASAVAVRVSEHFPTGLFASPAFVGTALHVFIIRKSIAFFRALRACISTSFTDGRAKGSAPRYNLGGCGAHIGAVLAGKKRLRMLRLTSMKLVSTMRRTRIALPLAIAARLRARLKHRRVLGMRGRLLTRRVLATVSFLLAVRQQTHCSQAQCRHRDYISRMHRNSPL